MGIADRLTSLLLRLPPWLLSAVAMALLLMLTLIPASDVPGGPDIPGLDKIIHFLMFGLTATALATDTARQLRRISIARLIAIALCVSLLGAVIEWLQEIMQLGRSAETWDLAADIAGSFLLPLCFWPLIRNVARNADVQIIRPTNPSQSLLKKVSDLYHDAFPPDERRPWPDLKSRIADPAQQPELLIIRHRGRFAGFISWWQLDCHVRYIEHFAILSSLRGRSIGSKALAAFLAQTSTPAVLEVEPEGSTSMADRRIAFYKRVGLIPHHNHHYIQPPYAPDLHPVHLTLMTTPLSHSAPSLQTIAATIRRQVHNK